MSIWRRQGTLERGSVRWLRRWDNRYIFPFFRFCFRDILLSKFQWLFLSRRHIIDELNDALKRSITQWPKWCKVHIHAQRAIDLLHGRFPGLVCCILSPWSGFSFTQVLSYLHPAHCIFSGFVQRFGLCGKSFLILLACGWGRRGCRLPLYVLLRGFNSWQLFFYQHELLRRFSFLWRFFGPTAP